MFDNLSNKLGQVFDNLKRRGLLKEDDVNQAMREIRMALLEADVALPVAKEFIEKVKSQAIGEKVLKSISPAQQVVKIVNDVLIETLGHADSELNLKVTPPAVILMAGLQGSGKTTTSGKIAKLLKERQGKKVLLASLDIYRPAAQEQLEILANQVNVGSLPIIAGDKPLNIAKRALDMGRKEGFDVVILDSAGRLSIDEDLMNELAEVKKFANPIETLLVVDALTGQDALNTATNFNDKVGVTGIVLTRIDSDARGGAALSMRQITGCPIKFLGMGEKMEELQPFDAERIAGRILDMGDIVSLVEKAAANIEIEEAQKTAKKMAKGQFDMNDLLSQLRQMEKMGGLDGIMSMLPGMKKMKGMVEQAGVNAKTFKRQEAIILSMTKTEREKPALLNASRRKRIALGSGTDVQDINKLMKQFLQMQTMMKRMGKDGMGGMMKQMSQMMGMGGMSKIPGMGSMGNMLGGKMPTQAEIEEMTKQLEGNTDDNFLGENPFLKKGKF